MANAGASGQLPLPRAVREGGRQAAWLLAARLRRPCHLGPGHHRRGIDTTMPWWWVPACLGYDVVVGTYIIVRFH